LEAGEKSGLPPGHALCTLQTIRVGGLALGIIPVPDLVLTSSYYCDMGSKTDELLHHRYGHQAIYIDGCMDSLWGEFPHYDEERVLFLGNNLNAAFEKAGEILGTQVAWKHLEQAGAIGMEYLGLLGQLTELMKADPLPVSGTAIELGTFLMSGCTGNSRKEGPSALRILIEEVKDRVKRSVGVVEKGAPRVLILLGHFSDPSIEHLYEEAGLADAAMLFSLPVSLTDQAETKYQTMGEVLAEREMRLGWYHSNFGFAKRAEQIIKKVSEEFNIDGVIWNYTYNCRPMAQTSHFAKKWLEEKTGLPILSLEMDYYDNRYYGTGALRTKVETFAQMLRSRKGGKL
jgi:benzoyl-CoA reductase/2-hydroxyglutaryl-CoA dehydratase subunit BcrC/BadD/HgdB